MVQLMIRTGSRSGADKSLQRPPLLFLCLYNMDLSTVAQITAVTSSGIFAGSTDSLIVVSKFLSTISFLTAVFARSNALASDLEFENRFHMVSLLRSDSDNHIRS